MTLSGSDQSIEFLRCPCGDWRRLSFDSVDLSVSDVVISGFMPTLVCDTCGVRVLPLRTKVMMQGMASEARKRNCGRVRVDVRNSPVANTKFSLCQGVDLKYSALDYYYIPGLNRDSGFLTPVFFSKDALTYFYHHPDYTVAFASDTYGTLRKKTGDYISFGLNRNGKLIMWLGDLAQLPRKDLQLLSAHAVESDHDVASEFYEGQIEVVFTDLSQEQRIIRAQGLFAGEVFDRFSGLKLLQMDQEAISILAGVRPPLHFTELEFGNSVEALTKLLIERIDTAALKADLQAHFTAGEQSDTAKLAGLKTLEMWLQYRLNVQDSAGLMLPLFVLYDLRVAFKHLVTAETRAKTLKRVIKRLQLQPNSTLEGVYRQLTAQLQTSFEMMFRALPKKEAGGADARHKRHLTPDDAD